MVALFIEKSIEPPPRGGYIGPRCAGSRHVCFLRSSQDLGPAGNQIEAFEPCWSHQEFWCFILKDLEHGFWNKFTIWDVTFWSGMIPFVDHVACKKMIFKNVLQAWYFKTMIVTEWGWDCICWKHVEVTIYIIIYFSKYTDCILRASRQNKAGSIWNHAIHHGPGCDKPASQRHQSLNPRRPPTHLEVLNPHPWISLPNSYPLPPAQALQSQYPCSFFTGVLPVVALQLWCNYIAFGWYWDPMIVFLIFPLSWYNNMHVVCSVPSFSIYLCSFGLNLVGNLDIA